VATLFNEKEGLTCWLLLSGDRALLLTQVASLLATSATSLRSFRPKLVSEDLGLEYVTEKNLPGLLVAIPHNYEVANLSIERRSAKLLRLLANWAFRLDVVIDNLAAGTILFPLVLEAAVQQDLVDLEPLVAPPAPVVLNPGATPTAETWVALATNIIPASNHNYIVNTPNVQLVLPTDAPVGYTFLALAATGGSFRITQNAAQTIRFGDFLTSEGLPGGVESTEEGDTIRLVCIRSPDRWQAFTSIGNLNYV
jgi:hypothetical protein